MRNGTRDNLVGGFILALAAVAVAVGSQHGLVVRMEAAVAEQAVSGYGIPASAYRGKASLPADLPRAADKFITFETRREGVSVLARVAVSQDQPAGGR